MSLLHHGFWGVCVNFLVGMVLIELREGGFLGKAFLRSVGAFAGKGVFGGEY